jgi:hypothetical protein
MSRWQMPATPTAGEQGNSAASFLSASEATSVSRLNYLRDRLTTEAKLGGVLHKANRQISLRRSIVDASNA